MGYLSREVYMVDYKALTLKNSKNSKNVKMKNDMIRIFTEYLNSYSTDDNNCLDTFLYLCGIREIEMKNNKWTTDAEIVFHTIIKNNSSLLEVFQDLTENEGHHKIQTKIIINDYQRLLETSDKY